MADFTQSDVDYLIRAKKFIHRTIQDNTNWQKTSPHKAPDELRIVYDIRRSDGPDTNLKLQFAARRELSPQTKWGIALRWHGERIRGLDHKLREDIIRGGLIVGKVRHWHEHQWTNEDRDKHVVDANAIVKNQDMRSLIETCLDRWNIEGFGHQLRLEDLK